MKTKITIEFETTNMKPIYGEEDLYNKGFAKNSKNKKWVEEHSISKEIELGLHAEFVTQVKRSVDNGVLEDDMLENGDDIYVEDFESLSDYAEKVSMKVISIERDNVPAHKSRATLFREKAKEMQEKQKAEIRKVIIPDIDVMVGKKAKVKGGKR